MSEIEKYYNGEIIVDFEEETELEKKYNEVAELYLKAVKKKIEYREEIERLNNIINELEKYFIEEIKDYDKHINSQYITDISREQYEGEKVCFEDALGKLQELKGSSNNE